MPTYSPKPGDITRAWHVIDATDVVLGRLATHAATLLRGKHKPTYAPHMDTGDFVIIVNAEKIAVSGNKRTDKFVYRHSGYPGGLRQRSVGEMIEKHPDRLVEKAIKGMLPKNRLGRAMGKKLKVYAGPGAPARRAEAGPVRDHPGRAVSSAEPTSTESVEEDQPVSTPRARDRGRRRGASTPPRSSRPSDDAEVEVDGPIAPRRDPGRVLPDRPIQTVGRRKEAIVRVRLHARHRAVPAQRQDARAVLPEQAAPAAHPGAAGHRGEDRALRHLRQPAAAAARPARPARCAWPSPGR